jgi:ABC-type transporter Mla subunit MlaD
MAESTSFSNSVRAGALLLTTAVTALVVVVILAKSSLLTRMNSYTIRFQMADGVAGLERGAEVRVAGLKVGRVTGINEQFDAGRIDIEVEMDASVRVFKDAVVMRSQPLLGSYSWLNFASLGTAQAGALSDGDPLDATPSGGLLATIVGPQNAGRANQMFDDLTAFTGSLADLARVQYPQKVVPILDDATSVLRTAREDYGTWRGDITRTLASAASAAGKLDATMDDAKVAVADAREVVAHFRERNMAQIDRILDDAEIGTQSFANALQSLDAEVQMRLPDLRALLGDLRTSAAQIKLATMEVRRSPWKLLYRPDAGELGRENLYEAARAFALASSDLRVAGETLQAAVRLSPERFENDPRFREAVEQQVTRTLERFQAAQQQLFDVLLDGKAPPTGSESAPAPFAPPPAASSAPTPPPAPAAPVPAPAAGH